VADVTQILNAIAQGDPHAAEELLPLVYDELRKLAAQRMAGEKPGQIFIFSSFFVLQGNVPSVSVSSSVLAVPVKRTPVMPA
jgi:hypothetical protein